MAALQIVSIAKIILVSLGTIPHNAKNIAGRKTQRFILVMANFLIGNTAFFNRINHSNCRIFSIRMYEAIDYTESKNETRFHFYDYIFKYCKFKTF